MFDEYIRFHARARPGAPAVITGQGAASFARLDADIDRAVAQLADLAVPADQAAAISIDDAYLHWVMILALAATWHRLRPAREEDSPVRIGDTPDRSPAPTLLLTPAMIRCDPPRPARARHPPPLPRSRACRPHPPFVRHHRRGEARALSWRSSMPASATP